MLEPVHHPQFIVPRIQATVRRLQASVWRREDQPLAVTAAPPSRTMIGITETKRLRFKPISKTPQIWGHMFDQRWWKLRFPRSKSQQYLFWDDQAEATVYHEGEPIYGIDPGHTYCPLPIGASDILIESNCCRTGVWVPGNEKQMSEHGSVFSGAYLATRDDDTWHAMHDIKVLAEALKLIHLPQYPQGDDPGSGFGYRPPIHRAPPIYRSVVKQLNDAIDIYENHGSAALRKALRKVYRSLETTNRSHTAVLAGHAHIDLVWLWPKRVAGFKAVHSFANALSVMERYPKTTFTYSQPASYRDVERLSPKLMRRVKESIRAGRWEATGTLEVESDTQLPCGEALVRSFELGRQGFRELNGGRRGPGSVVWLPDTFGYSAAIPQIMAGFGVPYFYTTKIHWGSATRFPHTSFRWRGNDGSEVLAHIIQDHYNQQAKPDELKKIAEYHQQADVHNEMLIPTGYGDGGGGPNEDMAERTKRINKLGLLGEAAGVPDVRWGRIDDFFDRLNEHRSSLPVWHGEMYLQYHRGTQTTHGDLKAAYRSAERALQVWEATHCATGKGPIDLDAWRAVVFNQFHDALPGSSIWEVCEDAVRELAAVAKRAMDEARTVLNRKGGKPCVFNPLALTNYLVSGDEVVSVPPLTGELCEKLQRVSAVVPKANKTVLENDRVCVHFDKLGQVRKLIIDGKPVGLEKPGAQLWTFPDLPANYDAWDIDRPTLSNGQQVTSPAKAHIENRDTLNASVCFTRRVADRSEVIIRYRLDPVRPVVFIDLDVDWADKQTLLKLAFPTTYRGRSARYGSPFGSTLRSQLPGPLEIDAMFEVPASRWAAVADDAETDGLAVVTEAKYGFGCLDGLLHVSLLRSAKITEPMPGPALRQTGDGEPPDFSDLGKHTVRLAVGRYYSDAPRDEQPAALAETLYNPPIAYTGRPVSAGLRGLDAGPGVTPAWAKPIGKDRWVLRLHETLGRNANCKINGTTKELSRMDLNNTVVSTVPRRGLRVKPYEIVSVGVDRR